jgi:carnitine 3-dehydrogenase
VTGALADAAPPLPILARHVVPPDWIDHNGHMNESRYLQACSDITDAFLREIGVDAAYIARGQSYYTVETHILHRGEARAGDALAGRVQLLGHDAKRLHLFVTIARDDTVLATLEQMMLHVDRAAGRAVPAPEPVLARLRATAQVQARLPRPEGAGRSVGAPRG